MRHGLRTRPQGGFLFCGFRLSFHSHVVGPLGLDAPIRSFQTPTSLLAMDFLLKVVAVVLPLDPLLYSEISGSQDLIYAVS